MKKLMLLAVFTISISSCGSKKENDIDKMTAAARENIENVGFKNNAVMKIEQFTFIKADTLNEKDLAQTRVDKVFAKAHKQIEAAERFGELSKLHRQQSELHLILHSPKLANMEMEDSKKNQELFKISLDSSEYYNDLASKMAARIHSIKNPKQIYNCSFLLKMVTTKNGKSDNFLDTIWVSFDHKNKIILN